MDCHSYLLHGGLFGNMSLIAQRHADTGRGNGVRVRRDKPDWN